MTMKYVAASALVGAFLLSSACTQSPQKLVEAGNRYHDSKKYKEASILYQKTLTKDKTYAEAYYREGLNLLDSGNPTGAANFLRRAIDLQPANTDADAKLAEIYLVAYAGNPTRFKQLLPEIKDLVAKIDKYQPNSFTGFRLQGLLDLAQNDSQGALESFAKANQLKPYSPDVVTWYAETLYNAKRADEAETLERNMLAHDKKWGPGYDFLFLLYSRAGNKDKAKAILEERVQNDPASALAIQNLANYQAVSGDMPMRKPPPNACWPIRKPFRIATSFSATSTSAIRSSIRPCNSTRPESTMTPKMPCSTRNGWSPYIKRQIAVKTH